MREVLLFLFNIKKTSLESCRMLVEAYGHNDPSETSCRKWLRIFKNHNFDLEYKERKGAPKRFEDEDLEAILDEAPCQIETQLAEALNVTQQWISKRLHRIGMVQKNGNRLSHDLTERAIEHQKTMSEILLKRKTFIHRIITGDKKLIHYGNPKRQRVWWDQEGVKFYEVLKASETITADCYQ